MFRKALFTDPNAKTQRKGVTCPRSHSWQLRVGRQSGSNQHLWPLTPRDCPLCCSRGGGLLVLGPFSGALQLEACPPQFCPPEVPKKLRVTTPAIVRAVLKQVRFAARPLQPAALHGEPPWGRASGRGLAKLTCLEVSGRPLPLPPRQARAHSFARDVKPALPHRQRSPHASGGARRSVGAR